MRRAEIGSIVVTDAKVAGILTERDLLRAAAPGGEPAVEPVRLWMTANPDVLGPDEDVDAAWTSLSHHHYRHLPVVDGDELIGVVSIRDLLVRPASAGRRARGRRHRRGSRAWWSPTPRSGRPWARGLLPLPPVLGSRAGRPPDLRGRLAPAVRRRAARRRRGGRFRSRGAPPLRALPAGLATAPAVAGALGDAARRPAHRGLGPRRRARAGGRPPTSDRGAVRSQALRLCRGRADDPRHRPPDPAAGSTRSLRATTWATPPTTSGCSRGRRPPPRTPGPSSST